VTVRVFMKVHRGPMDATAVCVYPWEKPLIEMVHGQDATIVTIDEMCKMTDGVASVAKLKLKHTKHHAPDMRQQLEGMCYVDPETDPAQDPDTEYGRLLQKYGMDKDLPIPVVTRVYGEVNAGAFAKVLKEFSKEKMDMPEHLKAVEEGMIPLNQMSVAQLREALDKRGIEWAPKEPAAILRKRLSENLAEA
jgi:hypothetical protein